jgi:hypothetical protein
VSRDAHPLLSKHDFDNYKGTIVGINYDNTLLISADLVCPFLGRTASDHKANRGEVELFEPR